MTAERVQCGNRREVTWDLVVDVTAQPLSSADVWVLRVDPDGTVSRLADDDVEITDPEPGVGRVVATVRFEDDLVAAATVGLVTVLLDVDVEVVSVVSPELHSEYRFAVYPVAGLRDDVA